MNRSPSLQIVLLLAGRGSRLGTSTPKCLTTLRRGESILDRQIRALSRLTLRPIVGVVGFRRDLIIQAHPQLHYVVNDRWAETNTAASLRRGLEGVKGCDLLWVNGDVVFDPRIPRGLLSLHESGVAIHRVRCGAEEVKFRTDGNGYIREISKSVQHGEGEAVGINLIKARDLPLFQACLEACADTDYFERALELGISRGLRLRPFDIGTMPCIEVDFPADLRRARILVRQLSHDKGPCLRPPDRRTGRR